MWRFIHSAASLAWDQATKIWGDPVLEGVAGFLGQLLQTSNAETQEMFATISPDRFGGWTPRERPSKQLLTFISSRMKTLKTKQAVREDENPKVPSRLVDTRNVYDGHEECVVTRYHPRCWRCGQRCDFYKQQKKNYLSFENFGVEKVWITHFLTMTLITSTQVASPNFIYCVNELLCMSNIMQISHKFVWPVRYR